MADQSYQYSSPAQSPQSEQPVTSWQEVFNFVIKVVTAIPKVIYKVFWDIFWRYLK